MKLKTVKNDVVEKAVAKGAKTVKAEKADATPKDRAASKFVSVDVINGARMRVAEYQDYTFSINDGPKRRLTDTELAADWKKQFPHAVDFTPFHVAGARRDYNKGVHSKAYPNVKNPASAAWFLDAKGGRTQTVPKAEAPAAKKADAAKAVEANPKAKVARKQTAA